MKPFAIAIAAIAMTFGAAARVEARECDEDGGGYGTTIVITGRDYYGRPIYAERYFIRMNSHGRPMFGYRPVRGGGGGGGYDRGGYDRDRDYRGGDHRGYGDRGERHRR
jgi:hypothetical protein